MAVDVFCSPLAVAYQFQVEKKGMMIIHSIILSFKIFKEFKLRRFYEKKISNFIVEFSEGSYAILTLFILYS